MSTLVSSQVTTPLHSPIKESYHVYTTRYAECCTHTASCQSSILNCCVANPVQSVKHSLLMMIPIADVGWLLSARRQHVQC